MGMTAVKPTHVMSSTLMNMKMSPTRFWRRNRHERLQSLLIWKMLRKASRYVHCKSFFMATRLTLLFRKMGQQTQKMEVMTTTRPMYVQHMCLFNLKLLLIGCLFKNWAWTRTSQGNTWEEVCQWPRRWIHIHRLCYRYLRALDAVHDERVEPCNGK